MIEDLVVPWEHQSEGVRRAENLPEFGFLFEPGTGKTLTTIMTLRRKFAFEKRLMRTLVLGPPIILENWRREFLKFSKIKPENLVVLSGSGAKRVELLEANLDGPKIFITNYESLTMMPDLFASLVAWRPEVLVVDESHKCKDMTTKRTKAVLKLSKDAQYRYILTGTPILNTPMDIFAQFLILDQGKTFGDRFYAFRARYFFDKNASMRGMQKYFPDWRLKPGAEKEIGRLMSARAMSVKKEECLDLPPLVRKTVYVEMSPEQKRHYLSMKDDFITFMGEAACTAELAITKALRLQQIVSGFLKTEDGLERELKNNPRQAALKELLEEITPSHKVLVWAVFRENYAQIRKVCEELDLEFVEVHGDVSSGRRQESVDRFNNDPKVRVFIGHPGAGGIGINLVAASYSIWYSRGFSLEQDQQAEARNHRGGSEIHACITRIDLVTKDTIDELVLKSLAQKEQVSEKTLRSSLREI